MAVSAWALCSADAQNLSGPYAGPYSIKDLAKVPGVPNAYGGLCFLDPDTLLIGGDASTGAGKIYRIDVTRNASNQVNGFVGSATVYKNAPFIDAGLTVGPGGVLFATSGFTERLYQYKPGGNKSIDKNLNLNFYSLPLQFVPAGFPGAGELRFISYGGNFYTSTMIPDGSGTYKFGPGGSPSIQASLPRNNDTGLVHVPPGSPVFNPANKYILVPDYGSGQVSAYQLNASGYPMPGSRTTMVDNWHHAQGAALDPLTNDVLVGTWNLGGGDKLLRISGFAGPPGVIVRQSGGSTRVTEGAIAGAGVNDTYTVVLNSQPTGNVTVTITPGSQLWVSNAALPGPPAPPMVATPLTLTFTGGAAGNWNVPQTVFVTAFDDFAIEGPHTGTITHAVTSADVNYSGIAVVDVVAAITDNDAPPGITITPPTFDVEEAGFTDFYQVVLNSDPGTGVSVTVTPKPDSQVTVSPAVLTFTGGAAGNWSIPQSITVTAVDDGVYEGPHIGVIAHAVASTNPAYNNIVATAVVANITDNDPPPPPASGEGTYGGSSGPPGSQGSFGFGAGRIAPARNPILSSPAGTVPGHYVVRNVSHRQAAGAALTDAASTQLSSGIIAALAAGLFVVFGRFWIKS